MSGKILLASAVFALISSSQASFKEDLTAYLTPWVNAALTAMPLLDLAFEEVWFLKEETMGMHPNVLVPIHKNAMDKLANLKTQVNSEEGKLCVGDLMMILNMSTEKYRTDGYCFKAQSDKAYDMVTALIKAVFPVKPTPACPIPVLCKIDLFSFNPRNLKEAMGVVKELQKHAVGLLKFIVYYRKDIAICRNNPEPYTSMAAAILRMAPVCVKK